MRTGVSLGGAGTIVNSGSILGSDGTIGLGIASSGSFVSNAAGGLIRGGDGVFLFGSGTLMNGGTITGSGTGTFGVSERYGPSLYSGHGAGVYAGSPSSLVVNAAGGTIAAVNRGVMLLGGTVVNSGSIVDTGTSTLVNGIYRGDGGYLSTGVYDTGGTVTNAATGSVSGANGVFARVVTNAGAIQGVAPKGAGVILVNGGTLINSATTASVLGGGVGVRFFSRAATLVNGGTVAGTATQSSGVWSVVGGSVTNNAGGTITGANGISIYTGAGTVVNYGSIAATPGSVAHYGALLAAGGSLTNADAGVITGRTP